MQVTHNIADYHEIKVKVNSTAEASTSFNLVCYCYTPNVPRSVEPCPIRVSVNVYRFKAWLFESRWVVNFDNWLMKYRYTEHFNETLAEYINETQGRNKYYLPQSELSAKMDRLIAEAKETTALLQSLNS